MCIASVAVLVMGVGLGVSWGLEQAGSGVVASPAGGGGVADHIAGHEALTRETVVAAKQGHLRSSY